MFEPLGLDKMKQQDGVVIREAPEGIIEVAEDFSSRRVPAPPEVVGELV